jgi:hypothetical protein
MALRSKFLEILNENAKFLKEGKFVKGNEESELPPTGDEDVPEEPQGGGEEQPQPEEQPQQPQAPETTFTDREQDILNVAVQIYRANPENPVSYKNEFSTMLEKGQYEELLGRLIAIADELLD